MRTHATTRPLGQDWLDQIFRAKAAREGGVIRRKLADIDREIGRAALEREVRRRGYHMLECGGHAVILCTREPIRILC
jgi:hypothetical protein